MVNGRGFLSARKHVVGFWRGVDYLDEGRWISRAFWLEIRLVMVAV